MNVAADAQRTHGAPALALRETPVASLPVPSAASVVFPCALATSLLLYLCYFPAVWGFLGWVALVPFLALVRSRARARWVYLGAYVGGLAFFLPAVSWMRVADPRMVYTWILLSIYIAFYFPVGLWLLRRIDRRTRCPLVLSLPFVWVSMEYLRTIVMGGFGWYLLGHTQHSFLPLIQISDVTGAFGVSFLVAAVNALVFEWLFRIDSLRARLWQAPSDAAPRRPALVFQSALVLLAFAGCLLYGGVRMNQAAFVPGPRLALIQSNVPQGVKNRSDAVERILVDNKKLNDLAASATPKPDLIVWPETSWPREWDEAPPELVPPNQEPESQVVVREFATGTGTNLLLGLNARVWHSKTERTRYNSALLVGPDGRALGRYDKMHRVPFGEYVPLRKTFPFMNKFAPYDYDYSIEPGEEQVRLPLGDYRFGVVICYEDTNPELPRGYVAPGSEKVDFLVNISNDGWFDGTVEHEEHLAICRFRAVETRRSIVRSVNMGVSAVIDGNGRVLAPATTQERDGAMLWDLGPAGAKPADLAEGRWGEFKKVPGVLFATVPIDDRSSLYAAWGDWLAAVCGLAVAGLVFVPVVRRRM